MGSSTSSKGTAKTGKGQATPSRRKRKAAQQAAAARHRRRQYLVIALAVVGVLGFIVFVSVRSADPSGTTEAEDFDLPSISDDSRVRLADFEGSPVVVNFFATWCEACDAELPGFSRVSSELEGEVVFVGVNSQESGRRMELPERHGIEWWPLGRDVGGPFAGGSGLWRDLGGGRGLPGTAFYDEQGSLLSFNPGVLSEVDLRAQLAQYYGVGEVVAGPQAPSAASETPAPGPTQVPPAPVQGHSN